MRGAAKAIRFLPLALVALIVLPVSPASAADCPNEAIRESQASEALPLGSTSFPDCMALEMVSPPKKFGQEVTEVSAFSADGARAAFRSKAALADTEGLQTFVGDTYLASRDSDGWATAPTSPPAWATIRAGGGTFGGPYAFTSDLARWALFGATQAQQYPAEAQFFTDGLSDPFSPFSPLLLPINDSGNTIQTEIANRAPTGSSADLSASVFPTAFNTTYFPEDPRNEGGAENDNSYLAYLDEAGDPSLALLARDKDGVVHGGRCGSELGAATINQGAISKDGSRIYFSTRPAQPFDEEKAEGPPCDSANPLRVMVREETPTGPLITELIPTTAPAGGDDLYQGASLDGSKVFLASPRKLTASDLDVSPQACSSTVGASKGCDLYLYDSGLPEAQRLTQVSKGGAGDPDPGKGADVLTSALAISPDGSHAYFLAQGVLTATPNPAGQSAEAGKPNLYLYESETEATSFLATLADTDAGNLWGLARSFSNEAYAVPLEGPQGGDGHVLLFVSKAALLTEDADGSHADVYRYDSAEATLECVSCAPGGPDAEPFDALAGPNRAATTPPSSNFAQQGRWASEDGETVAFATAAPLTAGDEDAKVNPYLWREGELSRLPGVVDTIFQRPIVSPDGQRLAFTTTTPLLPQDGDTARDGYLMSAEGGFPNPAPKTVCDPLSEGSCQGAPGASGTAPEIGTSTFTGPGNEKTKPKPRCRKGKVRRRGKCVQKPRKAKRKQGKQNGKANNRAAANRQGGSK